MKNSNLVKNLVDMIAKKEKSFFLYAVPKKSN
jgi:hypothetical protein